MTPRQRHLARHALGLPNGRGRSYRNRYTCACAPGTADLRAWEAMVDAGLAGRAPVPHGGLQRYWLTAAGARAALDAGEQLDPEDFPEALGADSRDV